MTPRDEPRYLGGFFELELPVDGESWHPEAVELGTGRSCVAAVVQHLRPQRAWLPFYICGAVEAAIREAGAELEFYALDERLEPVDLPPPTPGELVLAVNHFGLQGALMSRLAHRYGSRLVADNAQAFFERPEPGYWAFCSARKFFGVPDGAYLYTPEPVEIPVEPSRVPDVRHLVNRLIGRQRTAFRQFQNYELRLDSRVRAMSRLSKRLLHLVDYEVAQQRRRENYLALHSALRRHNRFHATLPEGAAPFCYPLVLETPPDRAAIAQRGLFVPTFWEEVIHRPSPANFAFERSFAACLLPLPVDHRYTPSDMAAAVRRLTEAVELQV